MWNDDRSPRVVTERIFKKNSCKKGHSYEDVYFKEKGLKKVSMICKRCGKKV